SVMVRNLKMRNGRPDSPILTWRNSTGPGVSRLIAIAIATNGIASTARPTAAPTTSNRRFGISGLRQEDMGGIDAILLHVVAHQGEQRQGYQPIENLLCFRKHVLGNVQCIAPIGVEMKRDEMDVA